VSELLVLVGGPFLLGLFLLKAALAAAFLLVVMVWLARRARA